MLGPGIPAIPVAPEYLYKTLLFTDLVDSTRLNRILGDQKWAALVDAIDGLTRTLLAKFSGEEVNRTDGYQVLFSTPLPALQFALEYHRQLDILATRASLPIKSRVGIHHGPIRLKSMEGIAGASTRIQVEGLSLSMAARIMSMADGGQTLLTREAFDLSREMLEPEPSLAPDSIHWHAHGEYRLKGLTDQVEVFEVGMPPLAPLSPPGNTDKAARVLYPGDEEMLGWRPGPGLSIPGRPQWYVRRKLGQGGFGEVWLAEHKGLREQHVFKFCFDAGRLRGLRREVMLFRALRDNLGAHERIIRVLDWNLENNPYYVELEYTEYGSVADWARSFGGINRIPLRQRLEIMQDAAEGLHSAHMAGIIHRDIKPSNILVKSGPNGSVRGFVSDFGIGLIDDPESLRAKGVTVTGTVMPSTGSASGTALYMAPELTAGGRANTGTDIYAFGVTMYQMVVGDLARPLSQGWERDVQSEALREIIHACVARPEERLQSILPILRKLKNPLAELRKHERTVVKVWTAIDSFWQRRVKPVIVIALTLLLFAVVYFFSQYLTAQGFVRPYGTSQSTFPTIASAPPAAQPERFDLIAKAVTVNANGSRNDSPKCGERVYPGIEFTKTGPGKHDVQIDFFYQDKYLSTYLAKDLPAGEWFYFPGNSVFTPRAGPSTLVARIDPKGVLTEANENNNVVTRNLLVPEGGSDDIWAIQLTFDGDSSVAQVPLGKTVKVMGTLGRTSCDPQFFPLYWYLLVNGQTIGSGSIGRGGSPNNSWIAEWTPPVLGTYAVTISGTHAEGKEANQANNSISTTIEVVPPGSVSLAKRVRVRTEPFPPVRGLPVTIVYDPQGGPLASEQQIFLHSGFDGWKGQILPRPAMVRRGVSQWSFTRNVPIDAKEINLAFSNKPGDGGFWDNNDQHDWVIATQRNTSETMAQAAMQAANRPITPLSKVGSLPDGTMVTVQGYLVSYGEREDDYFPSFAILVDSAGQQLSAVYNGGVARERRASGPRMELGGFYEVSGLKLDYNGSVQVSLSSASSLAMKQLPAAGWKWQAPSKLLSQLTAAHLGTVVRTCVRMMTVPERSNLRGVAWRFAVADAADGATSIMLAYPAGYGFDERWAAVAPKIGDVLIIEGLVRRGRGNQLEIRPIDPQQLVGRE